MILQNDEYKHDMHDLKKQQHFLGKIIVIFCMLGAVHHFKKYLYTSLMSWHLAPLQKALYS